MGPRGSPVVPQPLAGMNDIKIAQDKINHIKGLGGAGYRIRTCDPVITNHVLYQLS
jgi:hypothetical protein